MHQGANVFWSAGLDASLPDNYEECKWGTQYLNT